MFVRVLVLGTWVVAAAGSYAATTHAQAPTTAITPTGGARDLGTTVNQIGNTWDITGGTRRGSNLFDGFGYFSVRSAPVQESATLAMKSR